MKVDFDSVAKQTGYASATSAHNRFRAIKKQIASKKAESEDRGDDEEKLTTVVKKTKSKKPKVSDLRSIENEDLNDNAQEETGAVLQTEGEIEEEDDLEREVVGAKKTAVGKRAGAGAGRRGRPKKNTE